MRAPAKPAGAFIASRRQIATRRDFWSSGRRAQDGRFDVEEKRAILSSWATESCAVKSMPAGARKDRSLIRVKERAPRSSRLEQVAIIGRST
jgi:hypothetical protein